MNAPSTQYDITIANTANNLRTLAQSSNIRELSSLTLSQVDEVVERIAKVTPAGNVPGVILNGLIRLPSRLPPVGTIRRDINLLFKGVEQAVKDKAVYSTFFAGPAAVIWAYQNLLMLAGKDADAAFPEGTWQFYVDYALRDDSARHACETHGFDSLLKEHNLRLSAVDRLTAWLMTAVYTLHQYPQHLANEWFERVAIYQLQQLSEEKNKRNLFNTLYATWEKQRPYGRGEDVLPTEDYPTYRRRHFDAFLAHHTRQLPAALRQKWQTALQTLSRTELPAYQAQMSIRAYLEADTYGESRTAVALEKLHVGLIHQGRYYLIPACAPDSDRPANVQTVRAQVASILAKPSTAPPVQLTDLAKIERAHQAAILEGMNDNLRQEIETLRLAPIWLNSEPRKPTLPLSVLRQAERGVGDHPITLFDTGETMVFDLSHIFFDGTWGVALAEMMTNEALGWAVYLHTLSPALPSGTRPYSPALQLALPDRERIRHTPQVMDEVGAETEAIDVKAILALRKLFKQRNDLLRLTVNDLLILYRAIHAAQYRPSPDLQKQLQNLRVNNATREAATAAMAAIQQEQENNPAILIPVDASRRSPRDRVYPMTFEVPLEQLDLLNLHAKTLEALQTYAQEPAGQTEAKEAFELLRKRYLTVLAGFGDVLSRAKDIAVAGESDNVAIIKMMAHLPTPLQRLMDKIPGRFDVLNDIIKGREVISNVGAVAATSTLTRFITAKDNNEKKSLMWGIITTADGVMRITLRDFRRHVVALTAVQQRPLAERITQEYLESYAAGLNQYIADLRQITTGPGKG